jgi:hypothetical protein
VFWFVLEYGFILWDPSTSCASAFIERVQRKFLQIAAYRLNIPHSPSDYSPVLRILNISMLADHHHASNLSFLSNLLSFKIDSHFLLFLINFRVPPHTTRCSNPFYIPCSSFNYLNNSPIIRREQLIMTLLLLVSNLVYNLVSSFYLYLNLYIIHVFGLARNY